MDLEQAIMYALDNKAVLFAGAGFSFGAKNRYGNNLPLAAELSERLLKEIGYPETDKVPLSQASKSFKKTKGERALIDFLKGELLTAKVAPEHETICKIPWHQIFTTNFDDVIEFSLHSLLQVTNDELRALHLKRSQAKGDAKDRYDANIDTLSEKIKHYQTTSITTDIRPLGLTRNSVIHLNGYLKANEIFNTANALRLSDESYLNNPLSDDWQEYFRLTLQSVKAVIFVGFSGQGDYVINSVLASLLSLKDKAVFITRPNEQQSLVDMLEDYGTVCQIGIHGFAQKIKEATKRFVPSLGDSSFLSFELLSIEPGKDSLVSQSGAVALLHNTGVFDPTLLKTDRSGRYPLLLMRYQIADLKKNIMSSGDLTIHILFSKLGNGKTIALRMIGNELLLEGIRVYRFTKETDETMREVEEICASKEKTVILFENFYSNKNLIRLFVRLRSANIALVSTARTAVFESNNVSLKDWMCGYADYAYNLDLISTRNGEAEDLMRIFDENALWGELRPHTDEEKRAILRSCNHEMKNILLKTLDSNDIHSRYTKVIQCIQREGPFYELSLFCIIKSLLSIDLSLDDILALFADKIRGSLSFKKDENIREILDFDNRSYKLDSSIVAKKIISNMPDVFMSVIETLKMLIIKMDKIRDVNPQYDEFLRTLLSFKLIKTAFDEVDGNRLLLYYDRIRTTNYCANNVHFWLQFALACLASNRHDDAQRYINKGYSLIESDQQFNTFLIDTVQAECILDQLHFIVRQSEDIAYLTQYPDDIINRWQQANALLMVNHNRHSMDNISKRYALIDRYYPSIWKEFGAKLTGEDSQRVVKIFRDAIENMRENAVHIENADYFDCNKAIATLDACLCVCT